MKKLFLFFMFCVFTNVSGQTHRLQFDYDEAGNQIKRYIVLDRLANPDTTTAKNVEDLTESDLVKADIYDDIKYYPNPVLEQLYVSWKNSETDYVSSIKLYSLNGQLVYTLPNLNGSSNSVIQFGNCAEGLYTVQLVYSKGGVKTLKVLKQ